MVSVHNIVGVKGNAIANQFVLMDGVKRTFQSYDTEICYMDEKNFNKLYLIGNNWDYSNTTRKYFKIFVNEHTNLNYENKAQWLKLIKERSQDIKILGV